MLRLPCPEVTYAAPPRRRPRDPSGYNYRGYAKKLRFGLPASLQACRVTTTKRERSCPSALFPPPNAPPFEANSPLMTGCSNLLRGGETIPASSHFEASCFYVVYALRDNLGNSPQPSCLLHSLFVVARVVIPIGISTPRIHRNLFE